MFHPFVVRLYRLPLRAHSLNNLLGCCLTIPFGGPCTNLANSYWHIRLKRCAPRSRDVGVHYNAWVMCQRRYFNACIVCRRVRIRLKRLLVSRWIFRFGGLCNNDQELRWSRLLWRVQSVGPGPRPCSREKLHAWSHQFMHVGRLFVSLAVACAFA